jgi:hypothetical protein
MKNIPKIGVWGVRSTPHTPIFGLSFAKVRKSCLLENEYNKVSAFFNSFKGSLVLLRYEVF